ncbi:unnamed protein product [Larinioides sclopetarius]|uniref:Uncharacterized protein n=1 Tax=Larinioides sclopetarius TaxID=280406 RepID=A0AAV2BCV5_9ARAC
MAGTRTEKINLRWRIKASAKLLTLGNLRHFCTAFAISSPRVCPESGNNPSSSSFGPWDDIYLTKRVTCAVYFMSQDSSIVSDKAEAS